MRNILMWPTPSGNLLMESQIEIRTAKGLRMMCDITTNSDSSAQIRFSKLDLSDSIAVPLTVQVLINTKS